MKGLEQIEMLNTYVNSYYSCDLSNGGHLNELLQKITGILYYLETLRAEIHDMYETHVFNSVKDGNNVNRSVNEANVKYPEMYQLRRIMDAGYKVADAIRTNISFLKSELTHSKNQ